MKYEEFVANLCNGPKPHVASRLLNEPPMADLLHAVIGLSGEAGEVLDLVKKTVYYNRPLDSTHLLEELGDALHYLTAAAVASGFNLQDIMDANMAKLKARYPTGNFSFEAANTRLDKSQQKVP